MGLLHSFTLMLVLTALISVLNERYFKKPLIIGVLMISLFMSLGIIISDHIFPELFRNASITVRDFVFKDTLIEIMLSLIIFSTAFSLDIKALYQEKFNILLFITIGIIISTITTATILYIILKPVGVNIQYIHCLLFGAIISPTNPVPVWEIMKKLNVPLRLQIDIAGEALLHAGISLVLFLSLLEIARFGFFSFTFDKFIFILMAKSIGALVIGTIIGHIASKLIISTNEAKIKILITLALVMGGYLLSWLLNISGPFSVAIAGLVINGTLRKKEHETIITEHLQVFWEMIDFVLVSMLFMLLGFEIILISQESRLSYIPLGFVAIIAAFSGRLISVAGPIFLMKRKEVPPLKAIIFLTWSGVKGEVPVAMALSLPAIMNRDLILSVTYIAVIFSILFQGLTLETVIKKLKFTEELNEENSQQIGIPDFEVQG